MRCIESSRGTGSAGIQSGRSFAWAVDMTISSPRSIGSIFEYLSQLRRVEDQLVTIDPHIDRPVIFHLKRERRSTARDPNVARRDRNAQLFGFLNDVRPKRVCRLSRARGVFHFLTDEIVELESRKIGRRVLRP